MKSEGEISLCTPSSAGRRIAAFRNAASASASSFASRSFVRTMSAPISTSSMSARIAGEY